MHVDRVRGRVRVHSAERKFYSAAALYSLLLYFRPVAVLQLFHVQVCQSLAHSYGGRTQPFYARFGQDRRMECLFDRGDHCGASRPLSNSCGRKDP